MTRLPGTVVFALATGILLLASVLLGWRGLLLRDPLRVAFATILLGLALAMGYETYAWGSGTIKTISQIVAGEFATHPLTWLAFFVPLMLLAGALAFHFLQLGGRAHWWVFLGGGVAYVLGGLVSWRTGWLP